jgi:arginyl-tRNA synthetase
MPSVFTLERWIMENIKLALERLLSDALSKVSGIQGVRANVISSSRPEFGDYQANGVMSVAKQLRRNPRELAAQTIACVSDDPLIAEMTVAGPGFINIVLNNTTLACSATQALHSESLLEPAKQPMRVVVDYSGPNLAKEMHVGHLRGTIIGDCLVRVLDALGHNVIRQNHVGDWGTQFGMLIAYMDSLQSEFGSATLQLADLEQFYRSAKNLFDTDPSFAELARQYVVRLQQGDAACLRAWQHFIDHSLQHCETIYEKLRVTLTRTDLRAESFYNSDLPLIINELDAQGMLSISDGARCVFLDEFRGKEGAPLPAIVQKSDGGYLYATTDLAALRYRGRTLNAERILYVVDARQSLHFQQVFAIARKAGFVPQECLLEHIAYGTMMGKDGRPFKTRSGDTVKLQELLDEAVRRALGIVTEKNPDLSQQARDSIGNVVGIAAVKYSDLSKNRTSDYVFDWDTMLSMEGNTAPYMLYAYARIRSILRKQDEAAESTKYGPILCGMAEERALILKLLQYPEILHVVAAECMPSHLCAYLYELAGTFMRFYEVCPVLKAEAEVRKSRLALVALTAELLKSGLGLLGLQTLESM